jgi:DNA-binding NarL/FixJ family response regulator
MLRVLIADDHDIVRRGVRDVVETQIGWEVCGEANTGSDVLAVALTQKPNVAVLDVALPGLNGITVTRQLKQALPAIEVLLFTMLDDEETISGGLAAGARGYLLKSDGNDQLIAAISALGAHRSYFSPLVSDVLLEAAIHERKKSRLESFSVRELEVAQLASKPTARPSRLTWMATTCCPT